MPRKSLNKAAIVKKPVVRRNKASTQAAATFPSVVEASEVEHFGPKHVVRVHITSRSDVKDENVDFELRIG